MRSGEVLGGRYQLRERLGEGGFGTVWTAYDPRVQRTVAVKVGVPRSVEEGLRTAREARLSGNLQHPHIATVFDFGTFDLDQEQATYLVMEYIDGETLSTVLARGLPPLGAALEWAAQICSALAAAHDAGVVHRDVKPANVMVTRAGTVKVLDFGIAQEKAGGARLTSRNTVIGSMPYMAPERWGTAPVDERADLYALGCVLMEAVTGHLPFTGESWQELALQHASVPPPVPSTLRPGLPPALDRLVAELLAKDRDGRPAQARAVEARLRAIAAGAGGGAPAGGAGSAGTATATASGPPGGAGAGGASAGSLGVPVVAGRPPATTAGGRLRRGALTSAAAVAAVGLVAWGIWAVDPLGDDSPTGAGASSSSSGQLPGAPGTSPDTEPSGTAPSPSGTLSSSPSAGPSATPSEPPRPAPLPTDWFRFSNPSTGMCLTVPDASQAAATGLVQTTCGVGTEQRWKLTREGTGRYGTVYSVRNGNSGQCLSVDAARKGDGVLVTQYLCGDDDGLFPDQYWTFRYDARYLAWQLVNQNSGRCVAVREGGGEREQALQMACGSEPWLLWRT